MAARTRSRRDTARPCAPGSNTARCHYGGSAEERPSASSAPQKYSRAPSATSAHPAQRRKPSCLAVRSAPLFASERTCRCTLKAPPSLHAPNFAKIVTDAHACRPKRRLARIRREKHNARSTEAASHRSDWMLCLRRLDREQALRVQRTMGLCGAAQSRSGRRAGIISE